MRGQTVIQVNEVPKSVNAGGGGSRANHYAAAREKKRWEGQFLTLCLAARLPRPITRTAVSIELQFSDPGRRRDVENFRHPVVKPLADALVKGGWLVDDTIDYFEVIHFALAEHKIDREIFGPLVRQGMVIMFEWERDDA